jgi:hypothetical protein
MIIVELSRTTSLTTPLVNFAPFIYRTLPARRQTASYWTDIFGATGENVTDEIIVTGVFRKPQTSYDEAFDTTDLLTREQSWFWDNANQVLYIHMEHEIFPTFESFATGVVFGYSDQTVATIGATVYEPLVRSVPSVAQRADLINYDRMAFISGQVVFDNVAGQFDDIIDDPIYGNDVQIYYLEPRIVVEDVAIIDYALWSDGEDGIMTEDGTEPIMLSYQSGTEHRVTPPIYDRTELVPLASLYVEDYSFSKDSFSVAVQDKRKSQNSRILSTITAQGEWIPLVYGTPRRAKAFVTDADGAAGNVNYRVAETLTALGTVQVDVDGTWTPRTPASTDLATGSFVLSAANGRAGGATDGAPLACRVVEPTGIAISNVADIIVDLNDRVLDLPFDNNVYDTAEWVAESANLSTVAVVFDQDIELFEAIRILQNGSTKGFRYEIKADGLRTIRVDDFDRAPLASVDTIDIRNSNSMPIATDSAVFATHVTIAYAQDYNDKGKFLRVTDETYREDAMLKYRQDPLLEVEALVTTQALAESRGLWQAEKLSEIRGQATIELMGQNFYTLRIYDILDIDFSTTERVYFGKWRCQIIGVDPRFDGLTNRITAILIERVA